MRLRKLSLLSNSFVLLSFFVSLSSFSSVEDQVQQKEVEYSEIKGAIDSLKMSTARTDLTIASLEKRIINLESNKIPWMVISSILGVSVLALFGAVWSGRKYIKRKHKEAISYSDELLKDNRTLVREMIGGLKEDFELKETLKICVLTPTDFMENQLMDKLGRLGYKNLTRIELTKKSSSQLEGYDIFFIDNTNNQFGYKNGKRTPSLVRRLFEFYPKESSFFYYNDTLHFQDKNDLPHDSFSYANLNATINGNLIDLMRYHHANLM